MVRPALQPYPASVVALIATVKIHVVVKVAFIMAVTKLVIVIAAEAMVKVEEVQPISFF